MSKAEIMNKMSRTVNRIGFKFKKHSPEILVVAGVIGGVGAAVLACKATLKVNEVITDAKKDLDKIHTAAEMGATEYGEDYTAEDCKKDTFIAYTQTGVKVLKLYAPAITLGVLSGTAILASNNILRKRNVALAAAYATVDKSFKEYRGRVIERFGKDLDHELRYNIKAKEIEETVVEDDGSESVVKTIVEDCNPSQWSDYAVIYDDGCTGWTKDPELNKLFLRSQERYANERLQKKGHLFLNEVYDLLGIQRTNYGQIVGWIYDEKCPNGDNYVSFGIFDDIDNEAKRRFINGSERNILLDFNVDGPIYNLI